MHGLDRAPADRAGDGAAPTLTCRAARFGARLPRRKSTTEAFALSPGERAVPALRDPRREVPASALLRGCRPLPASGPAAATDGWWIRPSRRPIERVGLMSDRAEPSLRRRFEHAPGGRPDPHAARSGRTRVGGRLRSTGRRRSSAVQERCPIDTGGTGKGLAADAVPYRLRRRLAVRRRLRRRHPCGRAACSWAPYGSKSNNPCGHTATECARWSSAPGESLA